MLEQTNVYELDTARLSNLKCYFFFKENVEEMGIATVLEFLTFPPSNEPMNAKFHIDQFILGGTKELIYRCRFPREFKGVCERAAKLFGMTMKHMPKEIDIPAFTGVRITLEFPQADNLLWFEGPRCNNPTTIERLCEDIRWVGRTNEKLGID